MSYSLSLNWVVVNAILMLLLFLDSVFSFFFFKQKTAYEMRISDWSSDVCSSDLYVRVGRVHRPDVGGLQARNLQTPGQQIVRYGKFDQIDQIGRASCRERVCQYV